MPWVFRGLRDGVVTTRYPKQPDPYAEQFRAAVDVVGAGDIEPDVCPTGAIDRDEAGRITLDRARCVLCGRCVDARPDLFGWTEGAETAQLRTAIADRVRAFGRSVHIRHVDAGSDGSDEWEIAALLNPVYDVHRLGIFFTASPRHADILLVTGAGARGMVAPLARTYEAMAQPVVVIATGADAASGGLVSPSYATCGGVDGLIRVDIWVPGSPASPFSLLHAILLAMGRLR